MNYTEIIKRLCDYPKGILAADEGLGTIGRRFDAINVENNLENRVEYRRLLFTAPDIEKYISGVITFAETFDQVLEDGTKLISSLQDKGVLVGIKLDEGLSQMENGEKVCNQVEGLAEKVRYYSENGASFAKWRAVFNVDDKLPSIEAVRENARRLAFYAKTCLDNGLVPIVEPEVLADGDYSLQRSMLVSSVVLDAVFQAMVDLKVDLQQVILKPSFVRSGIEQSFETEDFARSTLEVFLSVVPDGLGGISFLSGGMTEDQALDVLQVLNKLRLEYDFMVPCSFSYGRALQASCLETWLGKVEHVDEAQAKFIEIASRFSAE